MIIYSSSLLEYVVKCKGHKNSKGETAEWCIKSDETGEIIASHKTKAKAERHLQLMKMFKHMKK